MFHVPVLLKEVIELLALQPGDNVVDGTLGDGGHTLEILKNTAPHGRLLAIESDPLAIIRTKKRFKEEGVLNRVIICHGNFRRLREFAKEHKWNSVQGVLFDLGISSFQLEERNTGFSFRDSGALIMKFNEEDGGDSAYNILNKYPKQKLKDIFKTYGEIKHAGAIADKIIKARASEPIAKTPILVRALFPRFEFEAGKALNPWQNKLLAQVWQALRIEVNDELNVLQDVLPQAVSLLAPFGRLVVISYHSLEDRIVKLFMKEEAKEDDEMGKKSRIKILTKKPLVPQITEIKTNPRSRSAKLRAAEKL